MGLLFDQGVQVPLARSRSLPREFEGVVPGPFAVDIISVSVADEGVVYGVEFALVGSWLVLVLQRRSYVWDAVGGDDKGPDCGFEERGEVFGWHVDLRLDYSDNEVLIRFGDAVWKCGPVGCGIAEYVVVVVLDQAVDALPAGFQLERSTQCRLKNLQCVIDPVVRLVD